MKTIIEMAREAGFNTNHEMIWINKWEVSPYMQRFAELVRADERERIKEANAPEIEKINAHIKSLEKAVSDERERLLQAVEEMRPVQDNPLLQNKPPEFWIRSFKQAIEARGNT